MAKVQLSGSIRFSRAILLAVTIGKEDSNLGLYVDGV